MTIRRNNIVRVQNIHNILADSSSISLFKPKLQKSYSGVRKDDRPFPLLY
jgi:hypothetical protein